MTQEAAALFWIVLTVAMAVGVLLSPAFTI
jgi:hypothetical protein